MQKEQPNDTEFQELSGFPEVGHLKELESERTRIETLLGEYMGKEQARNLGKDLFDWAVEVDEAVDKIKNDPGVDSHFVYDGKQLTPKSPGISVVYKLVDGLNFLNSINEDTIRTYSSGSKFNIAGFMDSLYRTYVSSASDALRYLEKNGTPGLPEEPEN